MIQGYLIKMKNGNLIVISDSPIKLGENVFSLDREEVIEFNDETLDDCYKIEAIGEQIPISILNTYQIGDYIKI